MNSTVYLLIGVLPVFLFVAYMFFDMVKNIIALYGWKSFVKYSSIVLSWICLVVYFSHKDTLLN